MKYNILDALGKKILFFDGGMGSMLQGKGMTPGENTDIWNFTRPEDIMDVHRQYAEAGSDILLTNMFGANRLKLAGTGYTVEQVVKQGASASLGGFAGFLLSVLLCVLSLLVSFPGVKLLLCALVAAVTALLYRKNNTVRMETL